MVNLFKNEKDESRKRYKTWIVAWFLFSFIALVFSNVLDFYIVFEDQLSEGIVTFVLGIVFLILKLSLIYITIWYGIESGMKTVFAWVLGLSILVPFMWWISIVYLLWRKTPIAENITTNS